jgi:hypothetical protein
MTPKKQALEQLKKPVLRIKIKDKPKLRLKPTNVFKGNPNGKPFV